MEIRRKKSVDILKKVCYNKANKAYILFCEKGGFLGRFAISKTERMEKMYRPLKKVIGLFAASALFLTTLSAPVFAEDPSETGAEEPAVSISINDFTEPHPLPTPDPNYVEISLEEYLERLANGEIFEDPSGDEKELALYASTGWEQVSGKWKYKVDGVYVVNAWKFINNNWYYFDGSGYMKTGWFRDQGNWYYLSTAADGGTEGAMTIGWKKLSGHWYYFNGSGVMQSGGFKTIDSKEYYFLYATTSSPLNGYMNHGWLALTRTQKLYCGVPGQPDSGMIYTSGWLKDTEAAVPHWYYLSSVGFLQYGWLRLDGEYYYLGDDGALVTGTNQFNEYLTARFDADGKLIDWVFSDFYAQDGVRPIQNTRMKKLSFRSVENHGYLYANVTVNISAIREQDPEAADHVFSQYTLANTENTVLFTETNSADADITYFIRSDELTRPDGGVLNGEAYRQNSAGRWSKVPGGVSGIDGFLNGETVRAYIYVNELMFGSKKLIQVSVPRVCAHEAGHAVGLRHTHENGEVDPGFYALMFPRSGEANSAETLQQWDLEELHKKYPN